ncbi:MAG: hypothetical protein ACOC1T_02905, partial [Halorhodospira sp.]
MAEPTFYDGEGNSESFPPSDFSGGGHNTIIKTFGRDSERFANSQYAAIIHGQGLYRGYAEDEHDLSEISPGDEVSFETTPRRPWFEGGWIRIESEMDSSYYLEGEIQSYDPESGDLTIKAVFVAGDVVTDSWRLFSQGKRGRSLEWKGKWKSDTKYPIYAVVLHDSMAWIAPNGADKDEEPGSSDQWEKLIGGAVTYRGSWDSEKSYSKNDIVTHQGATWIASSDTSAGDEPGKKSVWEPLTGEAPSYQGAWDADTSYTKNAVVTRHGSTWIANKDTSAGDEPGYASAWDRIAEG